MRAIAGESGVSAAERWLDTRAADRPTAVREALVAGAAGVVSKSSALDDVLDAIPVRILPTVNAALAVSAIGSAETVAAELDALIARYQPDELILVGNIYDQTARQRSFAMAAEILRART